MRSRRGAIISDRLVMKNAHNFLKKIDKVMLIDDDKLANFINKKLIHKMGITNKIIVKENASEALQYLQKTKTFPSLIILDIYMPRMDAFEFIEEFKKLEYHKKNNKTRIVILTASSDIDDLIRLKYLGKNTYWNKPLQEEKIWNLYNKYFKEEDPLK
jgi:CheY-like chemotaxis protein